MRVEYDGFGHQIGGGGGEDLSGRWGKDFSGVGEA